MKSLKTQSKQRYGLSTKTEVREALKAEYRVYLDRQRGLTKKTINQYCTFVDRFLDFRFGNRPDELSKITARDIAGFLTHLMGGAQPLRDKSVSSVLRSFFRFLFQSEKIETNLALGILSVAQNYSRRIPYHLTPDQVDTLLEAVRNLSTSKCKKRNYAMVLLMARLGLRSMEVIAIQLDDINWRSGELLVRGKGGRHDRVPLLPDIGEAIADYIQYDRKGNYRSLFVANPFPHEPFKDAQILNTVLKQALEETDIPRPKKYTVSHILRHSLATNLVRRGATLEEISDTLRHRSRATTLLYARQDIDGLRTIAQSWPLIEGGRS